VNVEILELFDDKDAKYDWKPNETFKFSLINKYLLYLNVEGLRFCGRGENRRILRGNLRRNLGES
jgi:hypothetical protein